MLSAQVVATAVVLTGFLMTAITWSLVGVVWAWSLVWFFVEDQVKIGAYSWLDRRRATGLETGRPDARGAPAT